MTDIEVFYELKKSVLEHYKKRYPYFDGNWKSFSSQDILNLIDDVQENTKNSVSEKWIYTHLKPETNEKLPRKDMLDIFSQYVGKETWNEYKFVFLNQTKKVQKKNKASSKTKYWILGFAIIVLFLFLFWRTKQSENKTKTIELNEKYSNDSISSQTTKAFVVEDSVLTEIAIENSKIKVKENAKVIVKGPFYEERIVDLQKTPEIKKVVLEPNDYANILHGFIKSDIKDWQTRKEQLDKILDENVEVIVMLQNNLGAEYFNKEEFSQKVIIPTPSLKQLQIVEIKKNTENKIIFIRLVKR